MELHKQILFKVLEEEKSKKKRELGIDIFVNNWKNIEIENGELVDDVFIEMCRETSQHLEVDKISTEKNVLVTAVMKRASEELTRITTAKEYLPIRFDEIKDNIEKSEDEVREEIDQFLEGITKDVIDLQHKAIAQISSYFLDNSDKLNDPELNEIIEDYTSSPEKAKPDIANKLYKSLYEKLKSDLQQKNALFWKRLGKICQRNREV